MLAVNHKGITRLLVTSRYSRAYVTSLVRSNLTITPDNIARPPRD